MARTRFHVRRPSKYRAIAAEVDGVRFHSKAEAKRYGELKLLLRAGSIRNLELQPEFRLRGRELDRAEGVDRSRRSRRDITLRQEALPEDERIGTGLERGSGVRR